MDCLLLCGSQSIMGFMPNNSVRLKLGFSTSFQ
jgi:hypothetical protein